jgi:hypothetical protein
MKLQVIVSFTPQKSKQKKPEEKDAYGADPETMFAITTPKLLKSFLNDNEKNKFVLNMCKDMLRGRSTEVHFHVQKNIEDANQFKKNDQARLLKFSEFASHRQSV